MKFQISQKKIFKTLSHLQGIVDKKNTLPILSNILLEAKDNTLTLSSTDMDISIVEKLDCNVLEDGSTKPICEIKVGENLLKTKVFGIVKIYGPAVALYKSTTDLRKCCEYMNVKDVTIPKRTYL